MIDILIHLLLMSGFFDIDSRGFTIELVPEFLATSTAFLIFENNNLSAGLLELFTAYVRRANIRTAMRDY